ncbi:unnamed protein product, partial [Ceratitis capitata]
NVIEFEYVAELAEQSIYKLNFKSNCLLSVRQHKQVTTGQWDASGGDTKVTQGAIECTEQPYERNTN